MDSIGGIKPFSYIKNSNPVFTNPPELDKNQSVCDGFAKTNSSDLGLIKQNDWKNFAGTIDNTSNIKNVDSNLSSSFQKYGFELNGINSKQFFYLGI